MPEVSELSYGVVLGYRTGPGTQRNKECLIKIPGVEDDRAASRYVGRKVIWLTKNNKKIVGEIVDTHGRNGVVRARFRRGLPGQAIGTRVAII